MRKTADLVCLVLLIATFSWLPRPTQSPAAKPLPAPPPPARTVEKPDKPVVVADLPGPKNHCHHVWRTMWGGPSQPWTCDVADLGKYCERCGEGLEECRARQAGYSARIAKDPAWQGMRGEKQVHQSPALSTVCY